MDADLRHLPAPASPRDASAPHPMRGADRVSSLESAAADVDRTGPAPGSAALAADDGVAAVSSSFASPRVNVPGQAFTGVVPPDPVGDVGRDYYIQAVNHGDGTQLTVYRKSNGTVLAGPFLFSDLFGEAGHGDPVVLYDHLADRWFLADTCLKAAVPSTVHILVSKTSDPLAGGWWAYRFETVFWPDFQKYGLWPDGYYLTTNEDDGPAYYALQRLPMLAGQTGVCVRVLAPPLAGFDFNALTPVDLDGEAPPDGAVHMAVRHRDDELHNAGSSVPGQDYLDLFEFHVDWAVPAASHLVGPTSVPVAEFDSDLAGASAFRSIPQPGTSVKLDPVIEVVMWRAQYRNFGTHQSIVGCFTTDTNNEDRACVRWFELRRTGEGAWSVHQQGTQGGADGVHRWLGSVAMDAGGNLALAYNVSSASSVYPGLRYRGRLATDPPGTLPWGEHTIAIGTAASSTYRYGDYSAMSVDPVDGCTFWFTGEYNVSAAWSTRIASFGFNPPAPAGLTAAASGANAIRLQWGAMSGVTNYAVYRRVGACPSWPGARLAVTGPVAAYIDTRASGGLAYSYTVRAVGTNTTCESPDSNCASAVTTGACREPPVFAGLRAVTNATGETCALQLAWDPAWPLCGEQVVYHVYRSTLPGFVPGAENRIASCLTAPGYTDRTVAAGVTNYYVVRSEDDSGMGDGPCIGGNVDTNRVRVGGVAAGAVAVAFADDMESGGAGWQTARLPADTASTQNWTLATTAGASPSHAWFCRDEPRVKDRALVTAAPIVLPAGRPARLEFMHRYDIERDYDGGVLEYSTDAGVAWNDILAGNGGAVPADAGRLLTGGYVDTVRSGTGSPVPGRRAWMGDAGASFLRTVADLGDMAGHEVLLRWRMTCDSSVSREGWWIDDVRVAWGGDCDAAGYAAWRGTIGWQGDGAPDGDDNGDGVANYDAYFFGLPPTGAVPASSLVLLPAIEGAAGGLTYGFGVSTNRLMAASYSVQTCTNLRAARWQPVVPTPAPDTHGRVQIDADGGGAETKFYRLRVGE